MAVSYRTHEVHSATCPTASISSGATARTSSPLASRRFARAASSARTRSSRGRHDRSRNLRANISRALFALAPEVVVLSTGAKQVFPRAALRAEFATRRIGLEVMEIGAACRTYNVLVGRGAAGARGGICCRVPRRDPSEDTGGESLFSEANVSKLTDSNYWRIFFSSIRLVLLIAATSPFSPVPSPGTPRKLLLGSLSASGDMKTC